MSFSTGWLNHTNAYRMGKNWTFETLAQNSCINELWSCCKFSHLLWRTVLGSDWKEIHLPRPCRVSIFICTVGVIMEGWPSKRFLSKHESVLSPDVWKWLFNSSTCERSTLQTLINSISSFSLTIKGGNFLPHYENKFNARESVDVKMSCCSEAEQSRDRNRDGGQKSRESTPFND